MSMTYHRSSKFSLYHRFFSSLGLIWVHLIDFITKPLYMRASFLPDMSVGEASIILHVALVLFLLCVLNHLGLYHPLASFISFLYLYKVNKQCSGRLWRRLQHEERKHANQRVFSGSESVRWLNCAVEKAWPLCMEQIASQRFLLPIVPWIIDRFKPWTAKRAILRHLYLGRSPPVFTEVRALDEATCDDHLLLELGLNFLAAEDMGAVIAVKLRKRLGFGIWAKMHVKGMRVEGKVLVGVKFIQRWPFIGRVRICFIEPPYIQITVKPVFHHGIDVADLPVIASWLDKTIDAAFERTIVEPNMLVIDVEKFTSMETESWFSVDVKCPVACAKVEIVEAIEMQPSDHNGLADPYVKGQLGPYRFQTKIQRRTLTPKWLEEFKVPISSWEACNKLNIEVRDKDHIFDDMLGNCSIDITNLRGGQRHDKWVALENIKTGQLHLTITISEVELERHLDNESDGDDVEPSVVSEATSTESTPKIQDGVKVLSFSEAGKKLIDDDNYDLKNIEFIVNHQPRNLSMLWKDCKQFENQQNACYENPRSSASSPFNGDQYAGENKDRRDGRPARKIRRGLHKLGLVLHHKVLQDESTELVNYKIDESVCTQTPSNDHMKEKAIGIIRHAVKSAHNLKIALKEEAHKKLRGGF